MKRVATSVVGLMLLPLLVAGNCSRARVESMNLMNEGVEYAQRKRHLEAIEHLERAGAVDPTNDKAFYLLAAVHIETGKFEAARDDLKRAISINDTTAGYHEKLGTVLMELEDWSSAVAALDRAIELDPSLFKAYFKKAQVSKHLDDPQSALQLYTDAIRIGPRFLEAYIALGGLYSELGYSDHAVQVLKSAQQVALDGTEEAARVHQLLGAVYQQQRKYDAAIREFREALDIQPGMSDALFSLGWTYSLTGNSEEAKRFLQKFIDVAAADAPAHYVKAARDRLGELGGGS